MARKKLIAGNWKMNGLLADGVELAKEIAAEVKKIGKPECEFLVCPPATLLTSVKKGAARCQGCPRCSGLPLGKQRRPHRRHQPGHD